MRERGGEEESDSFVDWPKFGCGYDMCGIHESRCDIVLASCCEIIRPKLEVFMLNITSNQRFSC